MRPNDDSETRREARERQVQTQKAPSDPRRGTEQLKVGTDADRAEQPAFPEPDPSPLDPDDPPPNNPPLHSDLMAQQAELEEAEREAAKEAREEQEKAEKAEAAKAKAKTDEK